MLFKDVTKNEIKNELQKIMHENEFQILDYSNIAKMRNEFYQIISKAKHYHIDVSDLFPIQCLAGSEIIVKFYQNGDVYMTGNKHVAQLHSDYGSDSICQDK